MAQCFDAAMAMLPLTPLHPLFGVEVSGVDLCQPLSDAVFAHIHDAFERHALVILRGQPIDDAQQVTFSRRFGTLEKTRLGAQGQGSEVVILTNIGADGAVVEPSNRQWLNTRANQLWHSDSSFKPVPAQASLLSGRIVPARGGETEFINLRAVWQALPVELQRAAEGKIAIHDFSHSRAQVDARAVTPEERAAVPPVRQPLVRVSDQGEKSIYIGPHVSGIEGMAQPEARALLDQLLAFAVQPQFVYTHAWRAHDLLIWDNRCTLHRGRPFEPSLPRYLVRATVAGAGPLIEQAVVADAARDAREMVMQ